MKAKNAVDLDVIRKKSAVKRSEQTRSLRRRGDRAGASSGPPPDYARDAVRFASASLARLHSTSPTAKTRWWKGLNRVSAIEHVSAKRRESAGTREIQSHRQDRIYLLRSAGGTEIREPGRGIPGRSFSNLPG